MPVNEYPILDGIAPSWADISVKIAATGVDLIRMVDIAAINTGRSVEVGEQRGATGGLVKRRTTGSASQEASMTLYRTGLQQMLRVLKDHAQALPRGNQKRVSLVHFNIFVLHTPPGDDDIYERRIKGCRITGDTMNSAEGSDAQQVEVPLSPIQIVDVIDGEEVVLL